MVAIKVSTPILSLFGKGKNHRFQGISPQIGNGQILKAFCDIDILNMYLLIRQKCLLICQLIIYIKIQSIIIDWCRCILQQISGFQCRSPLPMQVFLEIRSLFKRTVEFWLIVPNASWRSGHVNNVMWGKKMNLTFLTYK